MGLDVLKFDSKSNQCGTFPKAYTVPTQNPLLRGTSGSSGRKVRSNKLLEVKEVFIPTWFSAAGVLSPEIPNGAAVIRSEL